MKRDFLRLALALVVAFLFNSTASIAQTYDLNLGTSTTGCDYCATVQIRTADTAFNMGALSFVFDYNTAGLTFDTYTSLNFDENTLCGGTSAQFSAHSPFIDSDNGQVSSGASPTSFGSFVSCPEVTTAWIDVAEICFTVIDETQSAGLNWSTTASQFVVTTSQDITNQLTQGTLINVDEVLTCSSTGGGDVQGCTDAAACNFDASATMDDGSCLIAGAACDDGDPATSEDIIIAATCSCVGTQTAMFDCETLMANIGDACDDQDVTTSNDVVSADCSCAGTAVAAFDCMALMANIGDACDDGDANTSNDVVTSNCACAGTAIAAGCTVAISEPTFLCDSEEGVFTFTWMISGGLPGVDPTESYTVNGTGLNNLLVSAGSPLSLSFNDGTAVMITATDSEGCSATFDTDGPIACVKDCDNDITIESEFDCDEDAGVFTYTFTLGGGLPADDPTEMYIVNGTNLNNLMVPAGTPVVLSAADGTAIDITVSDSDESCEGIFSSGGAVACVKDDECTAPITIASAFDCDEDAGVFTYTFTIGGGEPASDPTAMYTVNGTNLNNLMVPFGTPVVLSAADGTAVDITVTDAGGVCSETFSSNGAVACVKDEVGCTNPITIVDAFQCDQASGVFTYTFTLGGGAPASDPTALYTVNGTNLNNLMVPFGTPVVLTAADGTAVDIIVTDAGGVCSQTFSSGGAVACVKDDAGCTNPIVVTAGFECDENAGIFTYSFTFAGGAPQANPLEMYTVNGTGINNVMVPFGTPLAVSYSDGTAVDITVTSSEGCSAVFSTGAPVACNKDAGTIGDTVFFDSNNNGIQDAGEAGIGGVLITLTFPDGSTSTMVTNANGMYDFTGLGAGNYTVTVGPGPGGFVLTTAGSFNVSLGSGEDYNAGDFGFFQTTGCTNPSAATLEWQSGGSTANVCLGNGETFGVNVTTAPGGEAGFFLITDASGTTILDGPVTPPFNFDTAPAGTCLIWHLTYNGGFTVPASGLVADLNPNECWVLSNPLTIVRDGAPSAPQVFAQGIGGDNVTTCNNAGFSNDITVGTSVAGSGTVTGFVLTDTAGNILAGPQASNNFNFLGAAAGNYQAWAITYSGDLTAGTTVASIGGCFALSNPINIGVMNCTNTPPPPPPPTGCPTVTAGGGLVAVCAGGSANVAATVTGQGNFAVAYVLHNTPTFAPSSVVGTSFNGVFGNPGGSNVTYYASVLVGTDLNADGVPDANTECYQVYPAQQVVFLDPVVISVASEVCDEESGITTVSWVVTGGLPSFNSTAGYAVSGSINGTFAAGQIITTTFSDGASSTISVLDPFCATGGSLAGGPYTCKDPLPIELLAFDGEVQKVGNYLYWVTATEIDNDFFTLERSFDAQTFEDVAYIDGAGNSLSNLSYSYLDEGARDGANYYRLRQTDFNGLTTVSETIELYRAFGNNIVTVSPVPAHDVITVTYESAYDSEVNVGIFDLTGRELLNADQTITEGITNIRLDLNSVPAGIYFLTINANDGQDVTTRKFIKD